ncbi:MAG TPA: lysoplasmalogenase [Ottowia sp.]|uniref:lysoplasmalogenase n=1 Tax=Ottowia sp. TaxID=1898956 RepID=UPI002CEA2003|nr:lysoplasmalogenase [Ottowia sp.]HMN21420.1 lysoplasmalogenase [Ottowia sp.]
MPAPEHHPKPSTTPSPSPRRVDAAATAIPRWFSIGQVLLLSGAAVALLLAARGAPWAATHAVWLATLLACLWALLAAHRGRIGAWELLMLQAGALAAATSALGLREWHLLAKPAAMVFALAAVAAGAVRAGTGSRRRPAFLLLAAALLTSLAGDVFLMLHGQFIPGLASFLLAHLFYIALFGRGVPWFGHRPAVLLALAAGAAMYAVLGWGGLPAALRLPVAAYVLVIALMTGQAWARQRALRDAAALQVALGACCFMVSDALLALNRFVMPLPWAALWVLWTYYAAQALIVHGMLGTNPDDLG